MPCMRWPATRRLSLPLARLARWPANCRPPLSRLLIRLMLRLLARRSLAAPGSSRRASLLCPPRCATALSRAAMLARRSHVRSPMPLGPLVGATCRARWCCRVCVPVAALARLRASSPVRCAACLARSCVRLLVGSRNAH